jgi:pyruvate/2-oxoglutarate dehydrogenase complex dihydrolipoamide acyltransferase (E2) component
MSEHVEYESLDALALGTLDPAQAEGVEQHLRTCLACRREYDELRSVIDILPHALPAEAPPDALARRIMTAIGPPSPRRRLRIGGSPVARGLAAALLLALIGDAYFALAMHAREGQLVVAAAPSATPATPTPSATAKPPNPTLTPRATPAASARKAAADAAAIAALERKLALARLASAVQAQQIARLKRERAATPSPPRIVRIVVTPPPPHALPTSKPTPVIATTAPPQVGDAALVAALRSGKVYAIDGVVDGEPWHLTIVQPNGGADAIVFSGTPDAPAGQTYRTWVIRGRRTVDIGELPPQEPTTLEMPMALQAGDVVAFSREPAGSGDVPTQPFLMELKIAK